MTSRHTRAEKIEALGRVIDTLDILRVRCPWDAKQTNESLRPNTIEETFELAEALSNDDSANIAKELGDVLLHILFYSKIGEEKGDFDIVDVADKLNAKLIYRHPHVFGDTAVSSAHDVELNWEQLKLKEKDGNKSVLAGVPAALPALIKADRIQEKAANVGFDWETPEQVWEKVKEEVAEVERVINEQIALDVPVVMKEMTLEEAKAQGFTGLFESKYGERVKTYSIGEFSKEICGGPHAARTGELGTFKIAKQENVSAVVKRIKAVLISK